MTTIWPWSLAFVLVLFCSCVHSSPLQASNSSNTQDVHTVDEGTTASSLRQQFISPAEVLGVLLLIGGDVVQKAIAQSAGRTITPVAFSFGWVAYSFGALLSTYGDGNLLPDPDCAGLVLNPGSGNFKVNESWLIGRLMRDLELQFKKESRYADKPLSIIKIEAKHLADKKPERDKVWWSWLACTVVQIGVAIAAIFANDRRNWRILLVTVWGIIFALITGSLPWWKHQKFACRFTEIERSQSFVLTRGNGHRFVFVIHSPPKTQTLNLEDLAVRQGIGASLPLRIISAALAVSWILLLITISGLDNDTWFLLGVGGLGMAHNVFVAGYRRNTGAHGMPLNVSPYGKHAVDLLNPEKGRFFDGLMAAEKAQPGLGLSLVNVFFNGRLRKDEEEWVKKNQKDLEERKDKAKAK